MVLPFVVLIKSPSFVVITAFNFEAIVFCLLIHTHYQGCHLSGYRKKDDMCEPLRHSADDSQPCAQYPKQATDIFIKWKLSRTAGLTSETFTTCIQTMGAIPELATYLQERHGFSYVLTGKFMSDPIEGRFGWYRQVNGGNFFMSVKQVLEAEKKIRSLSLLQHQALVSAVGMTDLDGVPLTESDISATEDVSWLIDFLSTISLDDLSEVDANIAFFVSGYIARSVVRRRCSGCMDLLVKHDDAPQIQDCVPEEHGQLFSMADRGGLSAPTELCFTLTALAVQYFMAILLAEHIKFKLFHLSMQNCFCQSGFACEATGSLCAYN